MYRKLITSFKGSSKGSEGREFRENFSEPKSTNLFFSEEYEQIYEIIEKDEVEKFEALLRSTDGKVNFDLINGKFQFQKPKADNAENLFQPIKPFTVAAICGSLQIMDTIIENKGDVCGIDWNGGNVVHCLVSFAFLHPEREPKTCRSYEYLTSVLNTETMRKLLMQENNDKLRPLEMAAQLGVFALFRFIFETDGVYLVQSERHGIYLHKSYDLTDYENFTSEENRCVKSPLHFLAYADKRNLANRNTAALLKWQLISRWIDGKFQKNRGLLFLWFIFRLVLSMLFFFLIMSKPISENEEIPTLGSALNSSIGHSCHFFLAMSTTTNRVLMAALALVTMGSLGVDFYEFFWWVTHRSLQRLFSHDMNGKKDLIVKSTWYRFVQFATVVFVAITLVAIIFVDNEKYVQQIAAFAISSFLIWGLFYFIQLLPSVGYYVIIIQNMIGDLLNFEMIFWLLFLPFPLSFYLVLQDELDCSASSDFSSLTRILHDTFLILLNVFDISHYMERLEHKWLLASQHVFFTLICAIMSINFLIALFSTSVSDIAKHSKIIMPLQRLSVICNLEWRCCKVLRNYYTKQLKSCTNFSCENQKVYFQTMESVFENKTFI